MRTAPLSIADTLPVDPSAPLRGIRVLSLALNLPGPAALLRLKAMGARCLKVEPPAGDPMRAYSPSGYDDLQQGVSVHALDLKGDAGRERLHRLLHRCDVLLTSFRPSALARLGLAWPDLQQRHPRLSLVSIVGAPGDRANEAGHDLTYQADAGLIQGLQMPATLLADMGGALLASEAVWRALWQQQRTGRGVYETVALSTAAAWLSLPREWALTRDGDILGGGHAGYAVYACRDGRVALAALEPHFARPLCALAGLPAEAALELHDRRHQPALTAFLAAHTRAELDQLAQAHDLPLHTLP